MMKYMMFIFIVALSAACIQQNTGDSVEGNNTANDTINEKNKLVEINGDMYIEYYPDKTNIKFKGKLDENGERMGRWVHYSIDGKEQSTSEYEHGVLNGLSMVKYPNGVVRYVGEYRNGKKVGKWVFRKEDGSVDYQMDYGDGE